MVHTSAEGEVKITEGARVSKAKREEIVFQDEIAPEVKEVVAAPEDKPGKEAAAASGTLVKKEAEKGPLEPQKGT